MSFQLWLESKTNPFVYHVTYYKNLDGISRQGLDYKKHGGSNFGHMNLAGHSEQGNFFTTDLGQVKNWIEIFSERVQARSTDPYRHYSMEMIGEVTPIILRFKINRNTHMPDDVSEYPNSYYTHKIIQPNGISCWDGDKWLSIFMWRTIDWKRFLEKAAGRDIEKRFYEYWRVAKPYPMPFDY